MENERCSSSVEANVYWLCVQESGDSSSIFVSNQLDDILTDEAVCDAGVSVSANVGASNNDGEVVDDAGAVPVDVSDDDDDNDDEPNVSNGSNLDTNIYVDVNLLNMKLLFRRTCKMNPLEEERFSTTSLINNEDEDELLCDDDNNDQEEDDIEENKPEVCDYNTEYDKPSF